MALTSTEEAQLRALIAQQAALLSLAGNETTITSKLSATKVNLGGIAAASSLADTDITLVRQGTADKSSTFAVIKTWITGSMASIATASGFASSLVANGYIKFPSWLGGWIVQWGLSEPLNQGANSIITLPIAFPSSNLITISNPALGTGVNGSSSGSISISLTQSQVFNVSASVSSFAISWVAIGK